MIKFITEKLDSEKYIETIDEQINTRATRIFKSEISRFYKKNRNRKLLGEFGEGRIPEWETMN